MNIRISCIKIFLVFLIPQLSFGQSLDKVIKEVMETFNYGKDYCNEIDSLIALATDYNYNQEKTELYGLKALCFDTSSELDSTEFYLELLLQGTTPRARGLAKSVAAEIQISKGENEQAIQSLSDAIRIYDDQRDVELIVLINISISWLHYGTFAFETAITYAEQAYNLAVKQENQYGILDALDILANCYGRLNQIEKSDALFQAYLEHARKIDNLTVSYWAACAAGNNFEFKSEHDSASLYFETAYQTALILEDSSFQLESLLYLGENAQRKGDNIAAIQSLSKVLQFPEKFQRVAILRRVNEYLSNAYAAIGNYEEAYQRLSNYKKIEEENWNNETRELTLDFEAKYQSLQKDNEIAEKNLTISKNKMQRNTFTIGALGLGLMISFLFYRSRKNQNIAREKIKALENQQKFLALDYMVQGQEDERKRIAQDLHDGLGGLLSTARLQLQKVHDEIDKLNELNMLGKAEAMIDDACIEVRRIAHDMMPGALTDLGLVEAIEDLSYQFSQKSDLKIIVESKTEEINLTDLQKIQLYRTIQEIINNAVKHASASKILVTFAKTKDDLAIEISDDGKGFNYDEAVRLGGLGLKNISSRIQYLNGSMQVHSEPQKGTTYHLNVTTN